MSESRSEKTKEDQTINWRGGYQPIVKNIKIDPETGLPPLPKGGTAEIIYPRILAHYEKIDKENKDRI
jgi:hypothetical protein